MNRAISSFHFPPIKIIFFPLFRFGAAEEFPSVATGICRGCRGLVNPLLADRVPPPGNPLRLSRRFAARLHNHYLTDRRRRLHAATMPPSFDASPSLTPLMTLRRSSTQSQNQSTQTLSSPSPPAERIEPRTEANLVLTTEGWTTSEDEGDDDDDDDGW